MNWLLLRNSLLVSGATTLLAVTGGLAAALWVSGLSHRWRLWVFGAAALAFALPPFLVTNCWIHYLGFAGVWSGWLPFNVLSPAGTVWVLGLMLWPITLFMASASWQKLEQAQLDAEPALAGRHFIRCLLLPAARHSLTGAAMLTFVLALNYFAVPAILQVRVLPAEIWVQFSTTFNAARAFQLSLPLAAAPLLLLLFFKGRRFSWPRLGTALRPESFRGRLGPGWNGLCRGGAILLLLLSAGLPLFQLVSLKRTWIELPSALAAGQAALWNSFVLASLSATAVVGLSLFLARGGCARLIGWASWLPLLLPGVLLGIAFIFLFNRPWASAFYASPGIVLLALVVRYLALGWNTVLHHTAEVDRDLVDAARLEGAGGWTLMRHAIWPQIGRPVALAWYVIFLLCLWDVESVILVYPPGGETLALRVFNLLHYGYNAQVNALCLTLLLLAVIPLLLWGVWRLLAGARRPSAAGRLILALAGCVWFLNCGCQPKTDRAVEPLKSRLFSSVEVIGSRGTGVGQLNKPRSVAVDAQDNLYVVDMTGRVQKFSAEGKPLLSWQMPQTDLGKPKGMGRDLDGNIMVIEPHYQRINHFSPTGSLVHQWGATGTNQGQFKLPRAVAMNSRREIFVSEYAAAERVQRFLLRPEGTRAEFIDSFGTPGLGPGEFNRPEGLCIDAQDRVYVADSCNHRIQVFSREGRLLRTYGKAGAGKGELSYPYDICVDKAGTQYVCEFGNSRIQVFDAQDRPLEIIGGPGTGPGRFSNPWGVALDSRGNLYVADSLNHRVQKLTRKEAS